MNRFIAVFFSLILLASGVAQCSYPECSGSDLHLALATAGNQQFNTNSTTGYGVVMFGLSNPATCVTEGVAYIVSSTDAVTSNFYGWALVCVNVPTCPAGTQVATTGAVNASTFAPASNSSAYLSWNAVPAPTLAPGIYGVALGTTCSGTGCASLSADVTLGTWYPFVQAADGPGGTYPWSFSSAGFSSFTNVPPTTTPVLGDAVGIAPPAAILY